MSLYVASGYVVSGYVQSGISIDWGQRIIYVPRFFLTDLGSGNYELDVNALRIALKDLEDDEEGMPFPQTHRHNTQIVLSGVTYARFFEVINGYTITFEEFEFPYTVRCVGANHNIGDVINLNSVNLIISNSAGLVVTEGVSGSYPTTTQIADAVWNTAMPASPTSGTVIDYIKNKVLTVSKFIGLK